MDTKLTLNIKKRVVNRAKVYAKKRGRSLSDLVENYLDAITSSSDASQAGNVISISPEIKKLAGSIKQPKNFDYKKDLSDAIWEKHLK